MTVRLRHCFVMVVQAMALASSSARRLLARARGIHSSEAAVDG